MSIQPFNRAIEVPPDGTPISDVHNSYQSAYGDVLAQLIINLGRSGNPEWQKWGKDAQEYLLDHTRALIKAVNG